MIAPHGGFCAHVVHYRDVKFLHVFNEIVDLVLPPACQSCGTCGQHGLCADCTAAIELVRQPYCSQCGAPFDPGVAAVPQLCSNCRVTSPYFDGARAFGLHRGPLRDCIVAYKFRGKTAVAVFLAELMARRVSMEASEFWPLPLHRVDLVVPVPLHPKRCKWRGFDQAGLLVNALAPMIEKPVGDCLQRVRDTAPQVKLSPSARHENLKNAFAVRASASVSGKSITIVDDVLTTGATANDAARALKAAGASAVYLLTVSRAVPEWHPYALNMLPPEDRS